MIGQNFHDQNCVNWYWCDYIDCLLNVSENRKLCVLSEHNTRFSKIKFYFRLKAVLYVPMSLIHQRISHLKHFSYVEQCKISHH